MVEWGSFGKGDFWRGGEATGQLNGEFWEAGGADGACGSAVTDSAGCWGVCGKPRIAWGRARLDYRVMQADLMP